MLTEPGTDSGPPISTIAWPSFTKAATRRTKSPITPDLDIGVRSNYQGVDGQFVARWENARLQVCAATPAAAIAGLRRYATICPHTGGNALPYPALAPVVKPSPMSTTVAADLRLTRFHG